MVFSFFCQFLIFFTKALVFLLKQSYLVRKYFTNSNSPKQLFLSLNFPSSVPIGLRGFFIDNTYRFSLAFLQGWEVFYIKQATGFLPRSPIRLGGFLPNYEKLHTYTFDGAYAKKEGNCNVKVTGTTITWPTYATAHLCIDSTSQTKKFYASYRAVAEQAMLLNCQLTKKDYLQINAFLAGGSGVKRNLKAL